MRTRLKGLFLRKGVKALERMNVLNNVRAAQFSVSFSPENGAAVTSLRTFVRRSTFNTYLCSYLLQGKRLKEIKKMFKYNVWRNFRDCSKDKINF